MMINAGSITSMATPVTTGYSMTTASFTRARTRGRRGRLLARLTGRPRRLLALSDVEANCTINSQSRARLRTVRIEQIRGSEGRCDDFDRDFNPAQSHTAERWRSIAVARGQERSLPPVELVQVRDTFFVRDGHHRVSVARALGQREIEAEVTVWEVAGRLPAGRTPPLPYWGGLPLWNKGPVVAQLVGAEGYLATGTG